MKIKGYSDVWKSIIRPPRAEYAMSKLGPTEFKIGEKGFKRTDVSMTNDRGMDLQCSHWEPLDAERPSKEMPCVIYLHGNSSSRCESLMAVNLLLPGNITVFSLDFAGSGKSEGEYISLGWYERDDVDTVTKHL